MWPRKCITKCQMDKMIWSLQHCGWQCLPKVDAPVFPSPNAACHVIWLWDSTHWERGLRSLPLSLGRLVIIAEVTVRDFWWLALKANTASDRLSWGTWLWILPPCYKQAMQPHWRSSVDVPTGKHSVVSTNINVTFQKLSDGSTPQPVCCLQLSSFPSHALDIMM